MKRENIFCCAFVIFFVLLIVIGLNVFFNPIAKIGTEHISTYEFLKESYSSQGMILNNIADDMAFDDLVHALNLTATDEEVAKECESVKDIFKNLSQGELEKLCKETILREKALDKLSAEIKVDADEAREHFNNNRDKYPNDDTSFEIVKTDMQREMGEIAYDKMFEEYRAKYEIKQ